MVKLLIPSFLLSLFGIFTVIGIRHTVLWSQVVYFIIAFTVFFAVKKIGRHFFQINAKTFYWLFVILLIVTFFIGLEVKGSRRWIDLYFYRFQASEFFKVFFILFLADFLTIKQSQFQQFSIFLKSLVLFVIPTFIIFKQPDLGNALVLVAVYGVMILFSDIPKKYLLGLFITTVAFIPVGWFFMHDYQKDRILSFISPSVDTQGTAYNMIQAVITTGSGKFFGRGLGMGTQSRLFFLPENITDFAYSSLVEQFGLFGGLLVIFLYGVMIWLLIDRLLRFYYQHSQENKEKFLYITGLLSYIIFQFFVNIGMNMGMLPIAGVALPFISYGGSSALAILIAFALVP